MIVITLFGKGAESAPLDTQHRGALPRTRSGVQGGTSFPVGCGADDEEAAKRRPQADDRGGRRD